MAIIKKCVCDMCGVSTDRNDVYIPDGWFRISEKTGQGTGRYGYTNLLYLCRRCGEKVSMLVKSGMFDVVLDKLREEDNKRVQ